jgi:protein involved in polysaccharide export with SLBB domain
MPKIGTHMSILRSIRRATPAAVALALIESPMASAQTQPRTAAQPGGLASTPPAGQPAPVQSPDYRLGNGDKVRVTVFGQQDLTGEYFVDGSGMLAFPLIGQVRAGGLTANELEREIANKLKPNYLKNPDVSAVVLTYRPFYIVGEVKTPGSYPYVSGMTVINAIALAGGFTYRAKESSFYLTRQEKDGSKKRLDVTQETSVQPGDVITVRERYF